MAKQRKTTAKPYFSWPLLVLGILIIVNYLAFTSGNAAYMIFMVFADGAIGYYLLKRRYPQFFARTSTTAKRKVDDDDDETELEQLTRRIRALERKLNAKSKR